MNSFVDILMEYYIVIVFIAVLLILALIGYLIDSAKTSKLKKELGKEEELPQNDIPIVKSDAGIQLGENVNNMTINNGSVNQNVQTTPHQTAPTTETKEEQPKLGTLK